MRSALRAAVVVAAMVAVVATAGSAGAQTKTTLEPYLEIELQRLEETYAVLERFAGDIWPGWTNYLDPEFRVQFPNLVFLTVGPRTAVPDGYQLVEGRTVHGKPIYINRKAELPITLQPPLGGGGGGGLTIRIQLQQFPMQPGVKPPEKAAANGDKPFEPRYDVSEAQILVYVHEFFHGFQTVAIPGHLPQPKPAVTPAAEKPPAPPPASRRSAPREPDIVVTLDYSTYSSVEALALAAAYAAPDAKQARERLADYLVARHLKRRTMTPREIEFENETQLGVEQIFVNGIGRLTLGDVSLTSIDTPMHRPGLWTVEWVDTNAADGVKGYDLTCRERAGSVCKGAEFKTAGFTLNAPEVELADTGNEVRITILSKVAR
jgi:hypothetical protein